MDGSAYEYQPSFILGFHGCDLSVGEKILSGKEPHLKPSEKAYDWLGHGVYFWVGNPGRAREWAVLRKKEGRIATPFVLGAIIDLRHCLDLFDRHAMWQVARAHEALVSIADHAGHPLPANVGALPRSFSRRATDLCGGRLSQPQPYPGLPAQYAMHQGLLPAHPVRRVIAVPCIAPDRSTCTPVLAGTARRSAAATSAARMAR